MQFEAQLGKPAERVDKATSEGQADKEVRGHVTEGLNVLQITLN